MPRYAVTVEVILIEEFEVDAPDEASAMIAGSKFAAGNWNDVLHAKALSCEVIPDADAALAVETLDKPNHA